jgi:hypothetical protein
MQNHGGQLCPKYRSPSPRELTDSGNAGAQRYHDAIAALTELRHRSTPNIPIDLQNSSVGESTPAESIAKAAANSPSGILREPSDEPSLLEQSFLVSTGQTETAHRRFIAKPSSNKTVQKGEKALRRSTRRRQL